MDNKNPTLAFGEGDFIGAGALQDLVVMDFELVLAGGFASYRTGDLVVPVLGDGPAHGSDHMVVSQIGECSIAGSADLETDGGGIIGKLESLLILPQKEMALGIGRSGGQACDFIRRG